MPDISISREQQAYIDALRDELDAEMAYGHVRVQDAVQYLIDHHREDGDLDVEIDPDAPEGQPGTDDDADDGGSGGEESGDAADADADEASEDADESDDADGDGAAEGTTEATDGSGVDDAVAALGNAGPGDGAADAPSENGDGSPKGETSDGDGAGTIADADSGKVEEMMNLLDAHDDVWEETDSSQGKYSVELPDGGSETVATKDDVRALLFKHYR